MTQFFQEEEWKIFLGF